MDLKIYLTIAYKVNAEFKENLQKKEFCLTINCYKDKNFFLTIAYKTNQDFKENREKDEYQLA